MESLPFVFHGQISGRCDCKTRHSGWVKRAKEGGFG